MKKSGTQIKRILSVILCIVMLASTLCLAYAAETDPADVCRTEYRYKDKEYKSSTSSSLTGWTKRTDVSPNPKTTYGNWSGWEPDYLSGNASLETQNEVRWRYYAFVCPWCGTRDDFQGPCSSGCGYNLGAWTWSERWNATPYYQSNYQYVSSVRYCTYSLGDGLKWYFGSADLYKTEPGTIDGESGAVIIKYWHRSRTKTTTYYYERWGAWSDWSTVEPQSASDRVIESRTILHDWDDGVASPAATCSAAGTMKYTCQANGCGATKTEPISINPNNHVNTKNVDAVASTCIEKGYSAGVYCNDCKTYISGHEEQSIDSTNHVNTKNVDAVASTCIEKGYSAGDYCNDCKTYISGHEEQPLADHQITVINAREATYTEEGYTGDEYCTVCKQTIKSGSVIPVLTQQDDPNGQNDPNGQQNDQNGQNDSSEQQGNKICRWCGQRHKGFLGMFVGIFHSILAFLFGAKY